MGFTFKVEIDVVILKIKRVVRKKSEKALSQFC